MASCATPDRVPAALERMQTLGWSPRAIDAGGLRLFALISPQAAPAETLTVFIEGDGYAWRTRTVISRDPTPRAPVMLDVAVLEAGPAAYLARPCQYPDHLGSAAAPCPSALWTDARYGDDAVRALDIALDRLKAETGAARLTLVGYSGGGALAVLLAADRRDVTRIVTLGAVLDHAAWTAHHGVSPLARSRNPVDVAARTAGVPQLHVWGGDDKIVPAATARRFRDALPVGAAARFVVLPGVDHDCCWAEAWPTLRGG